ncbi:hypothetical protein HDU76_005956 [Blyttiomyces sp. JEL0837]|nr:hypothetical protein HDU76_005956 [Blyttiomyces sp. JEL0837]
MSPSNSASSLTGTTGTGGLSSSVTPTYSQSLPYADIHPAAAVVAPGSPGSIISVGSHSIPESPSGGSASVGAALGSVTQPSAGYWGNTNTLSPSTVGGGVAMARTASSRSVGGSDTSNTSMMLPPAAAPIPVAPPGSVKSGLSMAMASGNGKSASLSSLSSSPSDSKIAAGNGTSSGSTGNLKARSVISLVAESIKDGWRASTTSAANTADDNNSASSQHVTSPISLQSPLVISGSGPQQGPDGSFVSATTPGSKEAIAAAEAAAKAAAERRRTGSSSLPLALGDLLHLSWNGAYFGTGAAELQIYLTGSRRRAGAGSGSGSGSGAARTSVASNGGGGAGVDAGGSAGGEASSSSPVSGSARSSVVGGSAGGVLTEGPPVPSPGWARTMLCLQKIVAGDFSIVYKYYKAFMQWPDYDITEWKKPHDFFVVTLTAPLRFLFPVKGLFAPCFFYYFWLWVTRLSQATLVDEIASLHRGGVEIVMINTRPRQGI